MEKARLYISGHQTIALLPMKRNDLRMMTGVLTGHFHLNRHLEMIGIKTDSECRWCLEEEETSKHAPTNCLALTAVKENISGSMFYTEKHSEDLLLC